LLFTHLALRIFLHIHAVAFLRVLTGL